MRLRQAVERGSASCCSVIPGAATAAAHRTVDTAHKEAQGLRHRSWRCLAFGWGTAVDPSPFRLALDRSRVAPTGSLEQAITPQRVRRYGTLGLHGRTCSLGNKVRLCEIPS